VLEFDGAIIAVCDTFVFPEQIAQSIHGENTEALPGIFHVISDE